MARTARLTAPGIAHHVVARGVDKMNIFRSAADMSHYLERAVQVAEQAGVLIHGYCLMPNHVHFLLTPTTAGGLARFFSRLHTWWAMSFNRRYQRSGHLFQCRYYSSPLSECHYWQALRYVELNPTRAHLCQRPEAWNWSSARQHLIPSARPLVPLAPLPSRRTMTPDHWRLILATDAAPFDGAFRSALRSSRPCGPSTFRQLFTPSRHASASI